MSYEFWQEKINSLADKMPYGSDSFSDERLGTRGVCDTNNPKKKIILGKKYMGSYYKYYVTTVDVGDTEKREGMSKESGFATVCENISIGSHRNGFQVNSAESFSMFQENQYSGIAVCNFGEASTLFAKIHKKEQTLSGGRKSNVVYHYNREENLDVLKPVYNEKLETIAEMIEKVDKYNKYEGLTQKYIGQLSALLQ